MDPAATDTVNRLIDVLAGRVPLETAAGLVAPDVLSHMDGFSFRGIDTWGAWLSFVRARSRVGSPDLETDRLETNGDGTVTAYGRWVGRENGKRVLSTEVWARYRVENGKVVEIWTHRGNYVFLLGPLIRYPLGLLMVMVQVFLWRRSSGIPSLRRGPDQPGAR